MELGKEDLQLERPFWAIAPDEVQNILDTPKGGLSFSEVERRLKHGKNEIRKSPRASKVKILLSQFTSPLILILIFAAGVTIFFKDYKCRLFSNFWCIQGIHRGWHLESGKKQPFYLPFGKAVDTASTALSMVRGKVLQLHLRRLVSAASSTFAALGSTTIFPTKRLTQQRRASSLVFRCE